ncbi:hypothetical protein [Schleiferilactobacillus perolens]|jgi:hypothetical protein|uniref:hypothetical protein n=1 Tax=Schleiferilactobacillus perolens TaxID=100468 RepID=UPI0023559EB8|nr:hypothetical protein [Schleiferilactobacillus perolens]MCI2172018.1 hypothetical protein [Schleiferilactobacillus perolens]
MFTHLILNVKANDIYDRKELQMRQALAVIIDNVEQNEDVYDDPDLRENVEIAKTALDDIEWIESNEKAADDAPSGD